MTPRMVIPLPIWESATLGHERMAASRQPGAQNQGERIQLLYVQHVLRPDGHTVCVPFPVGGMRLISRSFR